MNTFSSSSSVATHSPQPADLDPLAFSTTSSMQQQPPSVSPCPSSSLHAGHHVSLQQPSETYDHDSANTNSQVTNTTTTSTNASSNNNSLTRISRNPVVATTSTVTTTTTVVPPMMHDYWHGQTPLLLHNDPLRGDLDSVEVNHSERGIAGFVSKLYQSLQAPDDGQKYARWCKHDGKDMFIIECIPKFTEVVLPRLFKHCKFASFVRQLNIYGFQRDTDARKTKDTKDKESCRWHHPYFRPGRRDLFHLIRRKAARYPRRKRVKIDEDPATIVNVGSGDDDSDIDMNTTTCVLDDRRRSSSVSSVSQQPQDNYSNHHHNNNHQSHQQQQQDSAPFQMMYEGLPDLPVGTAGAAAGAPQSISVQEQKQQQQQHAAAGTSHQQQQPSAHQQQQPQQQTPSPYNPPGEVETSEVYNTTPVSETPSNQQQQQQVDWVSQHQQHQQHQHHQQHHHQQQQNNGPLDHRLLQEQDLRAQVTQLSQLCQGMRRSFDMQLKKAYKLIEDQGRRIQMLESDSFRGSSQNPLQQQQQPQQHQHQQQQQQQQQRSSDMGYMIGTPFPNHHHSPHNDLYTQFFPSNTDVRIKTEMGAAAAAAAAAAASATGGFNNGGGTGDRTDYENLYGLKLEATTTASAAPSSHHHQQHQHHLHHQHHHHSQIQQQQQAARPSMMKPSDSINQQQQQQQQPSWMPMFAAAAAGSNASVTDTPNSMHFQSTPPSRSGAAASIAAAAAVAAVAVTGEPSNNNNAPGDMAAAAAAAAYGHPGLSKYHHHPNRGIQ